MQNCVSFRYVKNAGRIRFENPPAYSFNALLH
jgi:hypothetical protein